ncbi:MAG: RNA 2',3'-cyclic phosphodiesterase [Candidatus Acidiferrum sp.]
MRLFVALEIPAAVRENLATLVKELSALSSQVPGKRPHWVRPENLHVTLKFIGEVANAKLEGIRGALSEVRSSAPVEMDFRGLGFFPNDKRPRVLWAGLKASPNLPAVAADVDRALETQGFAREQRAFAPHLTLARFEPSGMHEKLRAAIRKRAELEFGSCQASEFHLIESKLKPSGAEYTALASFPFTPEP